MNLKTSLNTALLSTALLFTASTTFAMEDPWADALNRNVPRKQLIEMCQRGMTEHPHESPHRTLWISRFKGTFDEKGSETLTPEEIDSLRKLKLSTGNTPPTESEGHSTLGNIGVASVEAPSAESEEERLKSVIKEQEEKIRLLELENKAKENQRRLEELEKEKPAPVAVAPAPVVVEDPKKAAEIQRIKERLGSKPDRETDVVGRSVQKWGNHYDRKAQKKKNHHMWGLKLKDIQILKLYNAGQLDMTSPPKKG